MLPPVTQAVIHCPDGWTAPAVLDDRTTVLDLTIATLARQGFTDILVLGDAAQAVAFDARRIGPAVVRVLPGRTPAGASDRLQGRFLLVPGQILADTNYRAGAIGHGGEGATALMVASLPVAWLVSTSHLAALDTLLETAVPTAGPGLALDVRRDDDVAQACRMAPAWSHRPAIFLDRDGVLNHDSGYVGRREDLHWLPGAKAAVRRINDAGYHAVVVSNQAGVARGYFSEDDVRTLHGIMADELAAVGAYIDRFYYCPYHPDVGLPAYRADHPERKPRPHMVLRAAQELNIDLSRSAMIGDRDTDMQCAAGAGVRGVLVKDDDVTAAVAAALAG